MFHICYRNFEDFFPSKTLSFCFVVLLSAHCGPGLIHILLILMLVAVDYYRLRSIMFTVYHRMLSILVVTHVTHTITDHCQYCLCVCSSSESLNSVTITAQICCAIHLNPLTPNDSYRGRTALLTSNVSFYIFI